MKRVKARMYTTYNKRTDEYTETLIQYLQMKIEFRLFGILWFKFWKVIDKETVPTFAWIQRNALGYTDWKSKWYGMADVKF